MNRIKILVIVFLFAFPPVFSATIIHVPDDQPTIQAGIDAAGNGDTVLVEDGTYTGSGNRNLDFNGKAITVRSENGPESCVIDCQADFSNRYRGFRFHQGEDKDSILQGFTIKGGFAPGGGRGGGIYCQYAAPSIIGNVISDHSATDLGGAIALEYSPAIIRNNVISNNHANWGGGIACIHSDPEIEDNVITENSVAGEFQAFGAGIYCDQSSPNIAGNVISNNSAYDYWSGGEGGGIYLNESSSRITHNVMTGNWAWERGAGICCRSSSPVIQNNIISRNNVDWGHGGGIYTSESEAVILDCHITHNIMYNPGEGGGICCSGGVVANCVVTNNEAVEFGGGIFCNGTEVINCLIANNQVSGMPYSSGGGIACRGDVDIAGCTIRNNSASVGGGGIYCGSGGLTIVNSILWGNDASAGSEAWAGVYYYGTDPSVFTISYSDVDGGQSSVYIESGSTLNWGSGMIAADPLFVNGPLGGAYLSQIAAGQAEDSPCVDEGYGSAGSCLSLPESGMICGTTITNLAPDTGTIDMGYHYPLMGVQFPPGRFLEEFQAGELREAGGLPLTR